MNLLQLHLARYTGWCWEKKITRHTSLVSRDVQVHTQTQPYAPCSVSQVFSCDQTDATLHGVPQGNNILLQDPFTVVHQEVPHIYILYIIYIYITYNIFIYYTLILYDTDTLDIAWVTLDIAWIALNSHT